MRNYSCQLNQVNTMRDSTANKRVNCRLLAFPSVADYLPSRRNGHILTALLLLTVLWLPSAAAHAESWPPTAATLAGLNTQSSDPQISRMPLPADWTSAQLLRSLSFDITSKYTGQHYRILIGLPHKAPPPAGYPVLWALDGLASVPFMQVSRPRPTSGNESVQWRKKIGDEPAGLIVGIGYASGDPFDVNARALDYTPATSANTGDSFSTQHGGDQAFLNFLTLELRPLIAKYFVLNPQQNTLFGFSYGGLFALNTLVTQPQFFQRYWAASPSLWFGEQQSMQRLPQRLKAWSASKQNGAEEVSRVTITVGRDEQYPASFASPEEQKKLQTRTMVDNAQRFAELLQRDGPVGIQVKAMVLLDHDHQDMLMHGARRAVEFAFAP